MDCITEFFDSLLKAKKMLHPLVAPVWANLEVGIAANVINIPIGSYSDFLQLDPSIFAVVLGLRGTAENFFLTKLRFELSTSL
jgi:hypothetical protein